MLKIDKNIILQNINMRDEIGDIIQDLKEATGENVFFDDSRFWTLGFKNLNTGEYFGIQRPYLGGGVRGAMRSNLEDDDTREIFKIALEQIEKLYNCGYENCETWDRPSGVLLNN